jgi:hypothetical protein
MVSTDEIPSAGPAAPTSGEIRIRKILGVLIILSAFSSFMFGFLFIPVALGTGIYLIKNRKYHPVADIFLLLVGLLVYIENIPLFAPPPVTLKLFLINFNPFNRLFELLISLTFVSKILLVTSALFLLACDLLVHFRTFIRHRKRETIHRAMVLLTFIVLLVIPLLLPVNVAQGNPGSWGSSGCPPLA